MTTTQTNDAVVYWHRQLPPLDAEPAGEYTLDAASARVPDTLAHRDELWDRCHDDLMARARERIVQETVRLGGHYARVLDEVIEVKHDGRTGEAWLSGRFTYRLYRRSAA